MASEMYVSESWGSGQVIAPIAASPKLKSQLGKGLAYKRNLMSLMDKMEQGSEWMLFTKVEEIIALPLLGRWGNRAKKKNPCCSLFRNFEKAFTINVI